MRGLGCPAEGLGFYIEATGSHCRINSAAVRSSSCLTTPQIMGSLWNIMFHMDFFSNDESDVRNRKLVFFRIV